MSKGKSQFVDFKVIKQNVTILQVLDHYGITPSLKRSGDNLSGCCPLHGGHNPTQFRVSLTKNCFNCFGECNAGGNVLDFVAKKENVNIREAALLIQKWFAVDSKPPRTAEQPPVADQTVAPEVKAPSEPDPQPPKPEDDTTPNKPLGFALQNIDPKHAYLHDRGLSKETIEAFGLGFCSKGMMAGRIVIPIRNIGGELVGYAGRWPGTPNGDTPKYKLPNGFRRGVEVFNLHLACKEDRNAPLILVQGSFGCFNIWQAGYKRVAAILGNSLSERQAALVIQTVGRRGHVMLLLDANDAGQRGQELALRRLASDVLVHSVKLPAGKSQPDQLTHAEALSLFS